MIANIRTSRPEIIGKLAALKFSLVFQTTCVKALGCSKYGLLGAKATDMMLCIKTENTDKKYVG